MHDNIQENIVETIKVNNLCSKYNIKEVGTVMYSKHDREAIEKDLNKEYYDLHYHNNSELQKER